MIRKRLNIHHFLPGFCLVFTLFVFAPADLYLSSAGEFWFSLTDLVRWLAIFAAAGFFLVTFLAVILPPKLSAAFRAAVYACSFLAWLQGNVLVQDYGTLDGRQIDWSAYTVPYILDAALWIAVIGLFIFLMLRFRKKFRRILEIAACVLLITQVVSVAFFLVRYRNQQGGQEERFLSSKGQFTVSAQDNTIVFVVDTVDSLFFEELIEKYPDRIRDAFEDFTFYRDTVGGAARTKYAIPFILCGDVNREERSYTDYLADAFAKSPLMNELASGKYDTGIYTYSQFVDVSRDDAIGNVVSEKPGVSTRFGLTKEYLKLVAFRYAPSVLSRYFWIYTGDFEIYRDTNRGYILNDGVFYKKLHREGVKAEADRPCFRFYHLRGVHLPITLDENCRNVGFGNTDETRQMLGVIKLMKEYLDDLKAAGVYDNATVMIMADHGSYDYSSVGQSPLFMVKLSGVSHPFEVSDMPMWFTSLPDMMISALRGTLTAVEPYEASNPRYFYKRSEKQSVVNLTEYMIDGPVRETEAVATGVVYHENSLSNSRDYTLGTVLYFNERDTARAHFVKGITNNEGTSVWTVGHDAEMLFTLQEEPGDLKLTMEHGTYDGKQTVEVWVNDRLMDTYTADGATVRSVIIPAGTVEGTELRLRLHLPDARSSSSIGKGTSKRLLGLSMKTLVISGLGD